MSKFKPSILRVLLVVLSMNILIFNVSSCNWVTRKYNTVAELLDDPVYNQDVKVEGVISLLGELFCPCFHLSSGGKVIEVWYDLMIEDDGTKWDAINVEGVSNGDTVIVSGQLKQKCVHNSLNDFWVKDIEKKNTSEAVTKVSNVKEAFDTVIKY